MYLSEKIKKALEGHPAIMLALKNKGQDRNWGRFTRTQFNLIARVINKQVSREVMVNMDLVEMHLIIGKQQLEKQLFSKQFQDVYDFTRYLNPRRLPEDIIKRKMGFFYQQRKVDSFKYWQDIANESKYAGEKVSKIPYSTWEIL